MPGFGSGSFGSEPFGEWEWSRRVLFDSIPEIYKQQDLLNGGYLELFAESLRPEFDLFRSNIDNLLDIRDPLLVRTQYSQVEFIRLGPVQQAKGEVTQRGVVASVDALQQFVAPTARFKAIDVGKSLYVSNSQFPQNNRSVKIVRVVSPLIAITDPLLVIDAGPLRWELRTTVVPPTDRITIEVRSGDISKVTPGWILFDGFTDFTVTDRRQFKTPTTEKSLLVEQKGTDGIFDEFGQFSAASGYFTQGDVGKFVSLAGFSDPGQDGKYQISRVSEDIPGEVRIDLETQPAGQQSSLIWAVLPFGELDLAGTEAPRGTVEQQGSDLKITASGGSDVTVTSVSAVFSTGDVGKIISIRGSKESPSNDGLYIVVAVDSPSQARVAQRVDPAIIEISNLLTWELRSTTLVGDLTTVQVHAPSMITDLAPDFGIEVDTQESDARQRSWVRNVTRWVDLKGHADAYRIVGAISGFNASVFHLFRVGAGLFSRLPSAHSFAQGEAGRLGSDGMLQLVGNLRFFSPSVSFSPVDIGRQIKISNAAVGGNNKYYTIQSIVDSHTARLLDSDSATLPDANNGFLSWEMVRLYTDLAPLRPKYDQVNADLLFLIVETFSGSHLTFRADMYCWEEDFYSTAPIEITSVSTLAPGVHQVSIAGTIDFPNTPEVVLSVGNWEFVSLTVVSSGGGDTIAGNSDVRIFIDSDANFTSDLAGQWIQISGSTDPGNDGLFPIISVQSSTTLSYFNPLGVAQPFFGTHVLKRERVFFVDSIPELTPAVASGSVTGTGDSIALVGVGVAVRLVDAAGLFSGAMVGRHVLISGASSAANNGIFQITAVIGSTQVQFDNPAGVAEAFSGTWRIGRGIYEFLVSAAVLSVELGTGFLRYICPVVASCDYCGSNKILAVLEASDELLAEGDVQVERLFERVTARLENEVKPAHVELFTYLRLSVEASLTLSATVDADFDSGT